jgi:hypothetical protein
LTGKGEGDSDEEYTANPDDDEELQMSEMISQDNKKIFD